METDPTRSELISSSSGMPLYSTGTETKVPTSGSRAKLNHSSTEISSENSFKPALRVSSSIMAG